MPKKRQGQALLIKPGSSLSSPSSNFRQNDSARPSVNDLIRESRRLQLKNEPAPSTGLTASVPPQIRHALSIPVPDPPTPRPRPRNGPTRSRRIPGPPPPRSWLTDSRHASHELRDLATVTLRLQERTSSLPGVAFPDLTSLQHFALKELARNWDWHAHYYGECLTCLPTKIREALLSYIAVYGDHPQTNALRLLFMTDMAVESRAEVSRLDLANAIGMWTSLKQLERDLGRADTQESESTQRDVPATWDDDTDSMSKIELSRVPSGAMFKNLQHLSLASQPGRIASWKELVKLAEKLPTITSLSLAHWPLPTYTPRAGSTRVLVQSPSSRPAIVYGGTNLYTSLDNNWREAAGILRSLSRSLYCLEWLDLTGCGPWLPALAWRPGDEENVGPEWNGWWRGVVHIRLAVGWEPVQPDVTHDEEEYQRERKKHLYLKEKAEYSRISKNAKEVALNLRALRKVDGGKWIDFEF